MAHPAITAPAVLVGESRWNSAEGKSACSGWPSRATAVTQRAHNRHRGMSAAAHRDRRDDSTEIFPAVGSTSLQPSRSRRPVGAITIASALIFGAVARHIHRVAGRWNRHVSVSIGYCRSSPVCSANKS